MFLYSLLSFCYMVETNLSMQEGIEVTFTCFFFFYKCKLNIFMQLTYKHVLVLAAYINISANMI